MIQILRNMQNRRKADWILNGGIDEEWDSYLKKNGEVRAFRLPFDQAKIF